MADRDRPGTSGPGGQTRESPPTPWLASADLDQECWRTCQRRGCYRQSRHLDQIRCEQCGEEMPVVCGCHSDPVEWLNLEQLREKAVVYGSGHAADFRPVWEKATREPFPPTGARVWPAPHAAEDR